MPKIVQNNGFLFVTEKEKNVAAIISMPFLYTTRIEHEDIKNFQYNGARMMIISGKHANVHSIVAPFLKIGFTGDITYHPIESGSFEKFFLRVASILINLNNALVWNTFEVDTIGYQTVAATYPEFYLDSYFDDKRKVTGDYREFMFRGRRMYRTSKKIRR